MKNKLLMLLSLGIVSCTATVASPPPLPSPATVTKPAEKKIVQKAKPYPLKTCLVTGDGLDDMDERVSLVYKGQTFEFCCKPCIKKFNKNPEKYVKELANR